VRAQNYGHPQDTNPASKIGRPRWRWCGQCARNHPGAINLNDRGKVEEALKVSKTLGPNPVTMMENQIFQPGVSTPRQFEDGAERPALLTDSVDAAAFQNRQRRMISAPRPGDEHIGHTLAPTGMPRPDVFVVNSSLHADGIYGFSGGALPQTATPAPHGHENLCAKVAVDQQAVHGNPPASALLLNPAAFQNSSLAVAVGPGLGLLTGMERRPISIAELHHRSGGQFGSPDQAPAPIRLPVPLPGVAELLNRNNGQLSRSDVSKV
jgi:hypothetical protein